MKLKKYYSSWMLAPCLILYISFLLFPALFSVGLSFAKIRGLDFSTLSFDGFSNYASVLMDRNMSLAIKNSFIFAFLTTIFKVGLGLILAVLLYDKFKTANYLRTVFFLPAVLSSVAVGLIFKSIMHPATGLLNRFLQTIGLGALAQNWLTDPHLVIFSLSFVEVWKWTGFSMVILLAGMQSIPPSYFEVTTMLGANAWQQFTHVTFPMIMPAFSNALIVNLIGGLKAFDIVQTITAGGPGFYSQVLGTLVYKSFGEGRYGEGSAASVLLGLIVFAIVLPLYRYLTFKEVEA